MSKTSEKCEFQTSLSIVGLSRPGDSKGISGNGELMIITFTKLYDSAFTIKFSDSHKDNSLVTPELEDIVNTIWE